MCMYREPPSIRLAVCEYVSSYVPTNKDATLTLRGVSAVCAFFFYPFPGPSLTCWCMQAHALSALVKSELTHKVGSIEQWQAWDASCSRLDDLPL